MSNLPPLRVLVVDDTIVYRKIVGDVIAEIPGVEVVGSANNGKIALSRIASLRPDLITLDIEMPEMNGIQVLEKLQEQTSDVSAIMLSTLTVEGGEMTIKALELGAFDFIPKPQAGSMAENRKAIKDMLTPMIAAIIRRREIQKILKGKNAGRPYFKDRRSTPRHPSAPTAAHPERRAPTVVRSNSEIVSIGISTGGPSALTLMMPKLPGDIGAPILIVQHMPPVFTQSLAKSLNAKCRISVKEAEDGEIITPATAYIAPGGKQMKVMAGADGRNRIVRITNDPPENSCKPSADYLFRSVADHYVGRATGVIMTGMGTDGNLGLRRMKANGAVIIAQSGETCTVYGMPKDPIESGVADIVAPLDQIAAEIVKTVKRIG